MKKQGSPLIFFIASIFLVASFISAIDVQFVNSNNSSDLSQGETLIAKVSGNFFTPITSNNIAFYRQSNTSWVRIPQPMDFGVIKLQDDFYFYGSLPLPQWNQGNYSFIISGVYYYQGTNLVNNEIFGNFTINNQTADFFVSPGALSVQGQNSFQVNATNLNNNQKTVQIKNPDIVTSQDFITLKSGEMKTIGFQVTGTADDIYFVSLSSEETSYIVPVFIKNQGIQGTQNNGANETNKVTQEQQSFELLPQQINFSMPTNSSSKRIFYLLNTGPKIPDINLTISNSLAPFVTLDTTQIENLQTNASQKIQLTFQSGSDEENLSGDILAVSENFSSGLTIFVNFIKGYVPKQNESTEIPLCSSLNGTVCGDGYECSGQTLQASDGTCCISPSVCQVKSSSNWSLWGWIILGVVLVILFLLYRKYKRVKK